MHPKNKIFKSQKYLEWIRKKACVTCGMPGPSVAHHVWHTGRKNHGNDYLAVPLCPCCHTSGPMAYHVLEHEKFEEKWNVDLRDEIINLVAEYADTFL